MAHTLLEPDPEFITNDLFETLGVVELVCRAALEGQFPLRNELLPVMTRKSELLSGRFFARRIMILPLIPAGPLHEHARLDNYVEIWE